VIIRGDRREGLTEDYLQVDLEGERFPRGTRLAARLTQGPSQHLIAIPA